MIFFWALLGTKKSEPCALLTSKHHHVPHSRFRVLCQTIIAHKLFDYVVLAFIFLNCITIALERPQIEAGSTVSD